MDLYKRINVNVRVDIPDGRKIVYGMTQFKKIIIMKNYVMAESDILFIFLLLAFKTFPFICINCYL